MIKHNRVVGDNSVLVAMVWDDMFVINDDFTYRSISKSKTYNVHEFMNVIENCQPIQIEGRPMVKIALVIYEDIENVLDAYNDFRKTEDKKVFFENLLLNSLEINNKYHSKIA
jgi:hypothetical protein